MWRPLVTRTKDLSLSKQTVGEIVGSLEGLNHPQDVWPIMPDGLRQLDRLNVLLLNVPNPLIFSVHCAKYPKTVSIHIKIFRSMIATKKRRYCLLFFC
jgi:hypothetical protein